MRTTFKERLHDYLVHNWDWERFRTTVVPIAVFILCFVLSCVVFKPNDKDFTRLEEQAIKIECSPQLAINVEDVTYENGIYTVRLPVNSFASVIATYDEDFKLMETTRLIRRIYLYSTCLAVAFVSNLVTSLIMFFVDIGFEGTLSMRKLKKAIRKSDLPQEYKEHVLSGMDKYLNQPGDAWTFASGENDIGYYDLILYLSSDYVLMYKICQHKFMISTIYDGIADPVKVIKDFQKTLQRWEKHSATADRIPTTIPTANSAEMVVRDKFGG